LKLTINDMKKLLLIFLLSFPAIAFAQMYGGGHFSRVTDSATYVNDAAVAAYHSAGYADIFYSTASDLWWKWNGTDYELIGSGSSSSGGSLNTFAPNVQTGNYTLVQADTTNMVLMRSTGAQNLTIPDGMKVGSTFMVTQDSTGTTTLVLDGVSADNASGTLTCSQDEAVTIYYKDVDNVIIYKSGACGAWGTITGTLSDQTDLQGELDDKANLANTATALTDGSSISITGVKHTLTTTQSAITFSDSWVGDFTTISVTFTQTSAVWTFPAGALCVVDGVASGDNTATVTGTSGDKIVLSIWDVDGTTYHVITKNFGQ
jgi:hypothetical protein